MKVLVHTRRKPSSLACFGSRSFCCGEQKLKILLLVPGPGLGRSPTKADNFTAAPDKRLAGVAPPSCGPTKTHPLQEEQAARTRDSAKVIRPYSLRTVRREVRDEGRGSFSLTLGPRAVCLCFQVYRGHFLWTRVAGECIPIAMIETLEYFCFKSIRNSICVQYALIRSCEL